MRKLVVGAVCLLAAGCSKAPDARESGSDIQMQSDDVAPATIPEAPGIRVTAAPGVAFDYRYAFKLPAERIAGAQEAHATACEKLGIARCRITGMRYTLTGENAVSAMLAFKLAPEIARAFGKTGIDLVKTAEGTLVDAAITGTDAGAAIDRLKVDRARGDDEVRRIDIALGKATRATERTELQAQRAEAQRRLAVVDDTTAEQKESLANTPMTFDYGSGPAIRGFDSSAPVKSALDTAVGSAQVTFAVVLGALAILGPPGLVLLLGWLLWRRIRPVWRREPDAPATP